MKGVLRWVPMGLAILGGVLLALCFPPFGWADLVWVGLWPLMVGIWMRDSERGAGRRGFGLGWLAGMVFWMVNLKWLATVTGPGYLILAAYLAVYFGVFGWFAATAGNPVRERFRAETAFEGMGRSVLFAGGLGLFWCGLEWLRGWLFTGFGWNGLGVAFHERIQVAQAAELVGVTGLSFLPVFASAVLGQITMRFWRGAKEGQMERHWDFGVVLGLMTLVFIYGSSRISAVNGMAAEKLRVLLVQLDAPQFAYKVELTPDEVHAGLEEETLKGLARVEAENERLVAEAGGEEVELVGVDWVVWPEVVLYGPIFATAEGRQMLPKSWETIERMQGAGVRTLIAGINEYEAETEEMIRAGEGTVYNSMIGVTGEELQVHRKQHLVIYGEFIPLVDSVPLLGKIYEWVAGAPWAGNMGRGEGAEGFVLAGAGGEVGVIPSICFEDTVGRVTRKFSRDRPEVMVNLTNDGWFGTSEGSVQHFANARFRAIELRRPMMRAANRGVTGLVSATGSLVDFETGKRQVLEDEEGKPFVRGSVLVTARVPQDATRTLYARWGDWFSVMGLGVGVVWWVVRKRLSVVSAKS
ncbi:MAG: apolipoprotein N-acyltransferase [Verrucomicrobiota bacterium]